MGKFQSGQMGLCRNTVGIAPSEVRILPFPTSFSWWLNSKWLANFLAGHFFYE